MAAEILIRQSSLFVVLSWRDVRLTRIQFSPFDTYPDGDPTTSPGSLSTPGSLR
jgi:hypothetical protein